MTIPSTQPRAEGAGKRYKIPQATLTALWTISNGRCYAPGCPFPVVYEVRPGHFEQNCQVAHIYGVKPGARRYRANLPAELRDSFANLLLLCYAHHKQVDGPDGDRLYPAELLREWKEQHEGAQNAVLDRVRVINIEGLMNLLTDIAEPPLKRLEAVTERLEKTGTVTADTVKELQAIIAAMSDTGGIGADTVGGLVYAAEVLGNSSFSDSAARLAHAAEVLPGVVGRLETAAHQATQFR